MPAQLNGVGVTVNGKPAFVRSFCSPGTTPVCDSLAVASCNAIRLVFKCPSNRLSFTFPDIQSRLALLRDAGCTAGGNAMDAGEAQFPRSGLLGRDLWVVESDPFYCRFIQ